SYGDWSSDVCSSDLAQRSGNFMMISETLVVLKRRELAESWTLRAFLDSGGYQAIRKALTEMMPDEVIKVVQDSGLRGRGGAGMRSEERRVGKERRWR